MTVWNEIIEQSSLIFYQVHSCGSSWVQQVERSSCHRREASSLPRDCPTALCYIHNVLCCMFACSVCCALPSSKHRQFLVHSTYTQLLSQALCFGSTDRNARNLPDDVAIFSKIRPMQELVSNLIWFETLISSRCRVERNPRPDLESQSVRLRVV